MQAILEIDLNKIKLRLISRCNFKHGDALELCEYNTMIKYNRANNLTTPFMYITKITEDRYDIELLLLSEV